MGYDIVINESCGHCPKPPMTRNGTHTSYLWWWLGDGLWHCFTHMKKIILAGGWTFTQLDRVSNCDSSVLTNLMLLLFSHEGCMCDSFRAMNWECTSWFGYFNKNPKLTECTLWMLNFQNPECICPIIYGEFAPYLGIQQSFVWFGATCWPTNF